MLRPSVEAAGVDGRPGLGSVQDEEDVAGAWCGVSFRQGDEVALKPGGGGSGSAGHRPGCSEGRAARPRALPLSKVVSKEKSV